MSEGLFIGLAKKILNSLEERRIALPRVHSLILRLEDWRLKVRRWWSMLGGKPI